MSKHALFFSAICLLGPLATAEEPLESLPMYGGKHIQTVEKDAALSRDAAKRAWKAHRDGDFDTAIRRFNQAWMFDPDNSEAYWGFGLVMGQRASQENPEENLRESIRFLEMALEKDPKNGRIMGDLAFSNTLLGHFFKSEKKNVALAEKHLRTAGQLFSAAFEADPKYPPIIANWSVFYFYTEDFSTAQKKADQAIAMGYKFEPAYLKDLNEKLNSRTSRSTEPSAASQ